MVRPTDLQDNLSKTQAVERIFQSMRQQPDNVQHNFAQEVQKMTYEQREGVDETKDRDQIKLDLTQEHKQPPLPQKESEPGKKKEKEPERSKSGDYLIDIII